MRPTPQFRDELVPFPWAVNRLASARETVGWAIKQLFLSSE